MQEDSTPLSRMIRDPFVARAFRRAEDDDGTACAEPNDPTPKLTDGAYASDADTRSTTLTFDRVTVERTVERLIGLLDRFDIDADYEPSLSWMNSIDQRFISDDLTGSFDLEFDVADARHDAGGEGDDWGSTVNTALMDHPEQAVMS